MGAVPADGAVGLSWRVEHRTDTATALHARAVDPGPTGRRIEVLEVAGVALVLGSTQALTVVDPVAVAGRSVEVVRRGSGGGAVLLVPGRSTWIDVTIGRDDPLWRDDVGQSFHWLGRAWVAALRGFGLDPDVHVGPLVASAWSRRICFAGLGAGEVTVGGRKLVGISQRRTRAGARFQSLVHRSWDPAPLLDLLALDDDDRAQGQAALAHVATGLDVDSPDVVSALLAALPR